MHFALPSNLQQELLAYDPKLKALAKEQAPKSTTKKAKYPLGKIPHLIPEDVVRGSYQDDAIEQINAAVVANRHHRFTKVVNVATPEARVITTAILYHFEQCWYAAWLPPKGQEDQYVYGYAYAFKNTASAAKTLPKHIWDSKDNCTEHAIGRGSQLFVHKVLVTKHCIINGFDGRSWRHMGIGSYYQKSREMNNTLIQFEQALMETIPTWNDSRSMFDRMKCTNILDAIEFPTALTNGIADRNNFQLSVDSIVGLAHAWSAKHKVEYTSSTYLTINSIDHIIKTPAIKARLQQMLDRSTVAYQDPDNEQRKSIKYGYREFEQTTNSIYFINRIWPDCPLDYYRTYFEELRTINLNHLRTNDALLVWLQQNMPVASFFNMMRKHVEQCNKDKRLVSAYSEYDYVVHSWYEMNDTFSMLGRVLHEDKTLEAPKRWRMPDFHDYVQAESWKLENKKESLHQDLFPNPVRVQVNNSDWTFFQPIDTHQLAQWGQAVRNCVGSASQYAEDIKKRKHFIVLCMIDGKPTFTIQLDVSMGVMNVIQISGVGNQRLDQAQTEQYANAFKRALQCRENELSSKS
jgi:hypothetical protein